MKDFTTGWFDTQQENLQAKCNARITRNFKEIRIDWTVLMSLKQSSNSISKNTYIDVMVAGNPTKYGEDIQRIKDTTESWNGTAEHSINGVLTFEDDPDRDWDDELDKITDYYYENYKDFVE